MSVQSSNKSRPKKLSDSTVKTLRLIFKTVLLPLLSALIIPNVQKLPAGPMNVAATANVTVLNNSGTPQVTPRAPQVTPRAPQVRPRAPRSTFQYSSGFQNPNVSDVRHSVKIQYAAGMPAHPQVNAPPVVLPSSAQTASVVQISNGVQNPNVSGVDGNVEINYGSPTTASTGGPK